MKESGPATISRKNYQAPNWTIDQTELVFELIPSRTVVQSRLQMRRVGNGALQLNGCDLDLQSIRVNGQLLDDSLYAVNAEYLSIDTLPDRCELTIVVHINPMANTALEGLYCSSDNFCTQCEAQGFRKITYYIDRPDVLSIFRVSIIADRDAYPVLLSNGNLESAQDLDDGRHQVQWHDPHPKPCYLFALVAGKLSRIQDTFTTCSNRVVDLHIYVEDHNIDQCQFAMDALQRSMKWDEQVYGLEYDLDLFMIVAVDDFNAGAMENKGLNIFNSKYVLAKASLATDDNFLGVEAVVAHEYFHNWTGNRVTCRDWFQLSLKEGLTVFREQEFSADMQSRKVKRIQDVRLLRAQQFAEDASPMSHPIRPDEYIEVNNFYTLTVYEKGAEVIRMIHTLLGPQQYYAGIDLYFQRHDGQAVTCDDFVQAMQDASGVDLTRFSQWYLQSGTPTIRVQDSYDATGKQYTLSITQSNPDSAGILRPPLHIPLRLGLLDSDGNELPLSCGRADDNGSHVLDVTENTQEFVFNNIANKPVPSLLRGFSAPVALEYDYDDQTLAFLLENDTDSFNRWEAGQRLAARVIHRLLDDPCACVPDSFVEAFKMLIDDDGLDVAFKALMLCMPDIKTISNERSVIDIQAIDKALRAVKAALAVRYQSTLQSWVTAMPGRDQLKCTGERSLANTALTLLTYLPVEHWQHLAVKQYENATNMTDRIEALAVLCDIPGSTKDRCVSSFYDRWSEHTLVVDMWFSVQARAQHDQVIDDVVALTRHKAFDATNPNRLRSLIGSFSTGNLVYFHASNGFGYSLVSENIILLDNTNPQVAARLVTPFLQWQNFVEPQQTLMRESLEKIAAAKPLSPALYELVNKALVD